MCFEEKYMYILKKNNTVEFVVVKKQKQNDTLHQMQYNKPNNK